MMRMVVLLYFHEGSYNQIIGRTVAQEVADIYYYCWYCLSL